jgi:heptosyltransferase II
MPARELIVRLPNWVGDVIMCLPALKLLHQQGIKLIVVGKPWIHDLLKDMPYEKHTFKDSASLNKIPSSQILLFTNSFSSALKARLAGKKSLGYANDGRRLLLKKSIPKPQNIHETLIFSHLAQQALVYFFGITPPQLTADDLKPELIIDTRTSLPYTKKPYIVLCPFAHGTTRDKKSKKWPQWQALATEIGHSNPIICPGPNEIAEAQTHFPNTKAIQDLSLHEYAIVLANAKLVIANDSGPMHIAAALNTPTIGLFGVSDPKRTGPKAAIILGTDKQWPNLEMVLAEAKPYLEGINSNL